MKFKTFYKLFYKHRFNKASSVLKLYLYIVLPIRFFLNTFFFPKKIDLDLLEKHSEGIIATTTCVISNMARYLQAKQKFCSVQCVLLTVQHTCWDARP